MTISAVLEVLDRASLEWEFIFQLSHDGSRALEEYDLDGEEIAALLCGDIRWIESRVGKLSDERKIWFNCRLQQEKW